MNREIVRRFHNPQSYNASAGPVFRLAFCTEYPFIEKQKMRGWVKGGSAGQGCFQVLGGQHSVRSELPAPPLGSHALIYLPFSVSDPGKVNHHMGTISFFSDIYFRIIEAV